MTDSTQSPGFAEAMDEAKRIADMGRTLEELKSKYLPASSMFTDFIEDAKALEEVVGDEPWPPSAEQLAATEAEAMEAQLAPRCIVENYLYADVGVLAAAGGTGKTTMMLHEAACIALGRDVWGLTVLSPGPTLILTKEDRRERLLARLREILGAMGLTPEDRAKVYRNVLILDVTGSDKKFLFVHERNIVRTIVPQLIAERFADSGLAQIIVDPTVSFGASESLVNDNEQQLVEVARYLVGELDCCLRYVHHTGQASARAGTLDQYASRGGTALPDGCRLVSVMKPHDEENKSERPPYGCFADAESSLTILARPKVSYAAPKQPHIWIKRTGFAYQHFLAPKQSVEERQTANMEQLVRFIDARLKRDPPERFNTKSLDTQADIIGMTRTELRAARELLLSNGRLEEIEIERKPGTHGRKAYYLCPVIGAG